jgi:uncharacterized surface protein with fasciclin (FAS1) repeats
MKKVTMQSLLIIMISSTILGGCGSPKPVAALSPESPFMASIASNPNLSTLAGLLKTPDLGKILGGTIKKPFTLLAPTNAAFEALGAEAVANLGKPENIGQLSSLLKNHLVAGKLDAATLMQGGVSTASGNPLNLSGVNLGTAVGNEQANIIPIDKVLK